MGCTGLVSIAQAAFYGVGAYTGALMALSLHAPFPMSLAGALVVAALIALLLAVPSLRLREDYFVIITFAFQIIIFSVMNNWVSVTGGPMGLSGIPQPVVFGLRVTSRAGFALLATCICALVFGASYFIANSPYGRSTKAIREDASVCPSSRQECCYIQDRHLSDRGHDGGSGRGSLRTLRELH